ncbi:MAG: DoxX family protein [Dongiaceae bacterium]
MDGMTNIAALVGRILIVIIFLLSGFAKITDFNGTVAYIASVGLPMPQACAIIAIIVEVIGGLCILVGFQARFAALIVAIFCVVAAFAFHLNFADPNQKVNFLKDLAIAGGLLQIFAFGPGAYSIGYRR